MRVVCSNLRVKKPSCFCSALQKHEGLFGDADAGKMSLLGSFDFKSTYIPTIGVDLRIRIIELDEFRSCR